MTDETKNSTVLENQNETDDSNTSGENNLDVQSAEFPEITDTVSPPVAGNQPNLGRIKEVKVSVTAELGRATMAIHELLALQEGSVVELNRNVTNPIELFAQGVPLGNGEVVVVDDKFAIRVKQIYSTKEQNQN